MSEESSRGSRSGLQGPEVVIPHLSDIRPLSAVKNVLIQSSLARLQTGGFYDRYRKYIGPGILQELLASLGPGWTPIDLDDAHYRACDRMMLTAEELEKLGQGAGERLETSSLSLAAKARDADSEFDLWKAVPALHRMWGRLYVGGSVQVAKLGPKAMLLELQGFTLGRHRYYRLGTLAAIAGLYESAGAIVGSSRVVSVGDSGNDLVYQLSWM
jgi:hypothetical protein